MGSPLPQRQDLTLEQGKVVPADTNQDCKRRRRAYEIVESGARGAAFPNDLDISQSPPDWWLPQPHATLDSNEYQDRPLMPLTRCLSCALCHELLREAINAPECGHTYCYDCIEARVDIGGNHNVCPVAGCGAVLGPNPFDHHRLMYDTLLDSLVQKIFPRPGLDDILAARRADREEATRRAREAVNGCCGRGQQHRHQRPQEYPALSQPVTALGPPNRTAPAVGRRSSSRAARSRLADGEIEGDDEDNDSVSVGHSPPGHVITAASGGGEGGGAKRPH